ncbi:MAG TPA: helix-turn-helix domain-containing protein, partial [Tahibacter sp.]|nr:helix-turn-helix domain-containing protein [Tahibacter sp.]
LCAGSRMQIAAAQREFLFGPATQGRRPFRRCRRRLAVMASGREIRAEDLPFAAGTDAPAAAAEWSPALRRWAEQELALGRGDLHARASAELERVLFDVALNASGGHRQQAAQVLGLGRNTLTRKLGSSRGRSR